MSKKHHISRADLFHIGKIIEQALEPQRSEEDGETYVRFKADWDDDRIAAVTKQPVEAVQKARRDMFGKIRRRGEVPQQDATLLARIAELERRIAQLEDVMTAPRTFKSFAELGRPNGSHP